MLREASLEKRAFSSDSYFVAARHVQLPTERADFDHPDITASYEGLSVRFYATIENQILTISGKSVNGALIPEYFRERDVVISVR